MPLPRVAVLLPCYNEGLTIGAVIRQCQQILPCARIYVYDNNSNDHTVQEALHAGAEVRHEPIQGKGAVVRRMFADIEADFYVLCDGDNTYDLKALESHIQCLAYESCDMLIGVRESSTSRAFPLGHRWGNRFFSKLAHFLFGYPVRDLLSGYRIFSRRFVKSFITQVRGFEIETELTLHAITLGMPIVQSPVLYGERAQGSHSKLSTLRDGFKILGTLFTRWAQTNPLFSFGVLGGACLGGGVWSTVRLDPTSEIVWLASFFSCIGGLLFFVLGFILRCTQSLVTGFQRLTYITHPAPPLAQEAPLKLAPRPLYR